MQSSMRAGKEAERILSGSPERDGKLGDVLDRSSASKRIPLPPPPAVLPMDDDTGIPSDDILRVLHSIESNGKIRWNSN